MATGSVVERLRADAGLADELHERSRVLLVNAVRAGAAAGLSQREIAEAVSRSQPEVSRLLRFHGSTELARRLVSKRRAIISLLAAHGLRNPRVFGSVARGEDGPSSDVDLLLDAPDGASLFTLSRLETRLGELLGADCDIVLADSLRGHLAGQVLREAVPL